MPKERTIEQMRAALQATVDSMRKKAFDLRMLQKPPREWSHLLTTVDSIEATLRGGDDGVEELYKACQREVEARRRAMQ